MATMETLNSSEPAVVVVLVVVAAAVNAVPWLVARFPMPLVMRTEISLLLLASAEGNDSEPGPRMNPLPDVWIRFDVVEVFKVEAVTLECCSCWADGAASDRGAGGLAVVVVEVVVVEVVVERPVAQSTQSQAISTRPRSWWAATLGNPW